MQGTASLWKQSRFIGNYEVKNLSIGGCLLAGTPEWELGQGFMLELLLPTATFSGTAATVVRRHRHSSGGYSMGMNFGNVSATIEDRIHDLVVTTLEKDVESDTSAVVVLHPHAETRKAIVEGVKSVGHNAIDVSTPFEAIRVLKEGKTKIHTLIVSRFLGTHDGQEMMRYMAANFPHVRRVLTGASDALPLKRSANFAHAIVTEPWDAKNLKKVLPQSTHVEKRGVSQRDDLPASKVKEILTA